MKSSKWMYGGHLTWGQLGSIIFLSCVYTVSSQTSNYIHPVQCSDEQIKKCRIRDQTDCPRPRTFYQSFDPENPCCPKYNCIFTGVTDGTNRYYKDQLVYYYGNCTIIQKNVIIDGIPDRWDIDEYFKDIEDVWGYVAIENNVKIDSVTFENLRIIRGQSVKKTLGERGAALFIHFNQQLSDFVAIFCCYNKKCFDKWTNPRSDYRRQDFVGLEEKACSRSETNLSQNSFEYSEVTMNCHQPMSSLLANNDQRLSPTHQTLNAYTLSRDGDGALLMSHEHNRNDETDSGCSSKNASPLRIL